ncbi:MAG: hypothetical protein NG747_10120 [Candidatus Brocadia sp.]|nr:hypothetical protein [Candidatus Brocadia sp.]
MVNPLINNSFEAYACGASGIEYIPGKDPFVPPLTKLEGVHFQAVENYTKPESARLLVYKAVWMPDQIYTENKFGYKEINEVFRAATINKIIIKTRALSP